MEYIIKKYKGRSLNEYLEFVKNDDTFEKDSYSIDYYLTFLTATDYIPNKLIESKILGIECKDYSEELAARQYAREQINLLKNK